MVGADSKAHKVPAHPISVQDSLAAFLISSHYPCLHRTVEFLRSARSLLCSVSKAEEVTYNAPFIVCDSGIFMALIGDLIFSSCRQEAFLRGKKNDKKKSTFSFPAVILSSSDSVLTAAINKLCLSPSDYYHSSESPNWHSFNLCISASSHYLSSITFCCDLCLCQYFASGSVSSKELSHVPVALSVKP